MENERAGPGQIGGHTRGSRETSGSGGTSQACRPKKLSDLPTVCTIVSNILWRAGRCCAHERAGQTKDTPVAPVGPVEPVRPAFPRRYQIYKHSVQ